jgi:hypothetical protein
MEKSIWKTFSKRCVCRCHRSGRYILRLCAGIPVGAWNNNLMEEDLTKMLLFANAAASIITTRKGSICSMPDRSEILSGYPFMQENTQKF